MEGVKHLQAKGSMKILFEDPLPCMCVSQSVEGLWGKGGLAGPIRGPDSAVFTTCLPAHHLGLGGSHKALFRVSVYDDYKTKTYSMLILGQTDLAKLNQHCNRTQVLAF